ncbi:MBL fold metallo-hydrolase [Solimonas sp. SE-A11]|uniref:MBL fold metallo-hydrolase n=1 Tax=Solimonas sp. SE-A11 TaxID=3054954 RepID=UPI00259CF448|nr:MBL fold metallo-hydrolase [Solimonas sp. SE-A11]MDM4772388.1 MBL fold metallo-hydrolase [Solimonas sp. SE-A11]
MKLLRRLLVALVVLLGLLAVVVAWLRTQAPGMDAYRAHHYEAAAQPGALTATWYGVSAVLLRDGEHAILIDPFFTRPEGLLPLVLNRAIAPDETRIAAALLAARIDKLDAVLVSHSHYDHGMDAGVVAKLTGAMLMGSASTANIGRGAGLPDGRIRRIEPGQVITVGRFRIRFIASRHAGASGGRPTGDITAPLHTPAHYLDYKLGGTYSILVEHPQGNVLHHGSAGWEPGALAGLRADLVFLGVALVDELPDYLRETVDAVGARRVIPVHWDDFTLPLDQPLRPFPLVVRLDRFFEGMAQRPEIQVQTLELGQTVTLFPASVPSGGAASAAEPEMR